MSLEHKIHTQLLKHPKLKKIVKRIYQRSNVFLRHPYNFSGNVVCVSPQDDYDYFYGYYDNSIMSKIGTTNLFYLPYLFGYSLYLAKKNGFDYWGIYVFTGSQGSGKTLSMVKLCYDLHLKYPKVPVFSNLFMSFSQHCNCWEDIYNYKLDNSIWCIDELGLWANSKKMLKP